MANTSARVRTLDPTGLRRKIEGEAAAAGLTLEDFVELGKSDRLDDDHLRELWLMYGPSLR